MAEDQTDESQKTEEPTEKRLREAREKGQVAKSQEVSHWFALLGFALILGFLLHGLAGGIGEAMMPFVARPHDLSIGGDGLRLLVNDLIFAVGIALLLPLGLMVIAALISGFVQTGLIMSLEPLKPKLEKISLIAGFKRLFSIRALVEFAKGILKLCIVATVIGMVLWPERDSIPNAVTLEIGQFAILMEMLSFRVLVAALAVMTVIAALDFAFQRYQHMKQLRMSKQELKDEFKQTEGDPMVKARLRQIRTERARQRMMSAVPEADVVVTNPTHYAVALKYAHGEDNAPRVTAKGVDNIAEKIREVATEAEVPLVENPPLARALYASVDIDQEIPPEHYQAVAEIISYVMRLRGRQAGAAAP